MAYGVFLQNFWQKRPLLGKISTVRKKSRLIRILPLHFGRKSCIYAHYHSKHTLFNYSGATQCKMSVLSVGVEW